MTTATPSPPLSSATEPRARFVDLVAAEWIKIRSLRSTPWALLVTALAVLAFNVGEAYDTYRYWSADEADEAGRRARFLRDGIPLQEAFTPNATMVLLLAAGAFGALAIVGEYRSGLIRTTFTAVPARRSLVAAKALVVAAVTAVLGALVAGASFWLTQAILSGRDAGVPIGHPGAWRVVVASALLAPVAALAGLALGALLRHAGSAVVAAFVLLVVLPGVLSDERHWSAVAGHATPYGAWARLVETGVPHSPYPWTTGGAWLVLALWPPLAAAVAVFAADRRDL
ncbi:ABC transporter permease subunit [Streptomyces formicae]|uniref:ABC transporter permease n=2 Tax=Streptomyces TaxID=1883 RepID=A0A1S5VI92_9ACTN|nr:ABC transporter permease subunit [Streptomyces formicae]AQP25579.1 ABC transporter permease [Streptomyces sp. KY5]ATL31701.1 putative integral membrane protein [Streptomyces formicae]